MFEAPIDLLSFLTLYPQDWQKHSYVALCGTSEHAMLWMLEQNPQIRKVALCLDHDEAGIEASGQHEDNLVFLSALKLLEQLTEKGLLTVDEAEKSRIELERKLRPTLLFA